jgi:hypothetical protein
MEEQRHEVDTEFGRNPEGISPNAEKALEMARSEACRRARVGGYDAYPRF